MRGKELKNTNLWKLSKEKNDLPKKTYAPKQVEKLAASKRPYWEKDDSFLLFGLGWKGTNSFVREKQPKIPSYISCQTKF